MSLSDKNQHKGEYIMLNFVKVFTTVVKFKLQGLKPTIYRTTKTHPNMERGYFIRMGTGGKSGERLLRVNMGTSYSSFPVYSRKGKQRVNEYVPIKGNLTQVRAN
jgi:hypothetical protein|tara:strand:- start:348 stop:662 length:315 start_codon:yes stop_codon:yes gene_type:complete